MSLSSGCPRSLRVLAPAVGLGLMLLAAGCQGGGHRSARSTGTTAAPSDGKSTMSGRAGELSLQVADAGWSLPAPVSRAVALNDGGHILLLGGLAANKASTGKVFSIDPASGQAVPLGGLAQPAHDAAGLILKGAAFVLGGGEQKTIADVQRHPLGTAAGPGTIAGAMPQARSDLVTAMVGGKGYVLGGYDGTSVVTSVLETADGTTFTAIANLPQGVRYPAVVVDGTRILVFGGETAKGQTDAIQAVDVDKRTAAVVGHLPAPLSHEAAVTLSGHTYLAGGRSGQSTSNQVLAIDLRSYATAKVATLPTPLADSAAVVIGDSGYLLGGESPTTLSSVITLKLGTTPASTSAKSNANANADAGRPWKPGDPPFSGRLLIADRGNNRLIVVNAAKQILWEYPSASAAAPAGGFYFPDDAFFTGKGTGIITNQEGNHTIVRLAFPSGAVTSTYGHPRSPGSAPGYLRQPDDAFLLADGRMVVADAQNCRVLFISAQNQPESQIGKTGRCVHGPGTLGYPNGDTPLANGNLLVSEITGSWIDEITPSGQVVWSVHLRNVRYPSDPQQLGPDLYLAADFSKPGGIVEFTSKGEVTWTYQPTSPDGALDHPSLAERLPNGLIAVNDDFRNRVIMIDPSTNRIVWQYGQTDHGGITEGLLHIPDGFDLLLDDGSTPTHPTTG